MINNHFIYKTIFEVQYEKLFLMSKDNIRPFIWYHVYDSNGTMFEKTVGNIWTYISNHIINSSENITQ